MINIRSLSVHKLVYFLLLPQYVPVLGNHARHDFLFHLFVLKWILGMQSSFQALVFALILYWKQKIQDYRMNLY